MGRGFAGLALLAFLVSVAGAASAQGTGGSAGAMTVAVGGGRGAWDDGPWIGHARLGPERVPERGLGVALDAGWLWVGPDPGNGVGTASPSLVLGLGRRGRASGSVRGGYTLLFREGIAHAAHAGLALDRHLRSGGRIRLELRDTFLPQDLRVHVVEVTVGIAFPMGGRRPQAASGQGRLSRWSAASTRKR